MMAALNHRAGRVQKPSPRTDPGVPCAMHFSYERTESSGGWCPTQSCTAEAVGPCCYEFPQLVRLALP